MIAEYIAFNNIKVELLKLIKQDNSNKVYQYNYYKWRLSRGFKPRKLLELLKQEFKEYDVEIMFMEYEDAPCYSIYLYRKEE
ncbi:hypothetical protein [Clostridium butyricum]|jgi:hypothetical protein|uniref:Uncharacterized protein n=1 Tax=Clostridium butyricum TaxID=1492 RepID=A0A6N3BE20_CLOBU|nr:hypothetical protein [Clostridium butyricum]